MSRQQQSVTKSTAEAEYIPLSEAVANGLWIKNMLNEIFKKKFEINLNGDNRVSLFTAAISKKNKIC